MVTGTSSLLEDSLVFALSVEGTSMSISVIQLTPISITVYADQVTPTLFQSSDFAKITKQPY